VPRAVPFGPEFPERLRDRQKFSSNPFVFAGVFRIDVFVRHDLEAVADLTLRLFLNTHRVRAVEFLEPGGWWVG